MGERPLSRNPAYPVGCQSRNAAFTPLRRVPVARLAAAQAALEEEAVAAAKPAKKK